MKQRKIPENSSENLRKNMPKAPTRNPSQEELETQATREKRAREISARQEYAQIHTPGVSPEADTPGMVSS